MFCTDILAISANDGIYQKFLRVIINAATCNTINALLMSYITSYVMSYITS